MPEPMSLNREIPRIAEIEPEIEDAMPGEEIHEQLPEQKISGDPLETWLKENRSGQPETWAQSGHKKTRSDSNTTDIGDISMQDG